MLYIIYIYYIYINIKYIDYKLMPHIVYYIYYILYIIYMIYKKRKLDKNPSRHPDIAIPRDNVNEAYKKYVLSNTEEKYEIFQETKRKLQEAYDKIESDDLEKTV